jgi:hypothetical protein
MARHPDDAREKEEIVRRRIQEQEEDEKSCGHT